VHEIVVAAREVAFRPLDLDHPRAGIGEPARAHRRRDRLFERNDKEAGEGEVHLKLRYSLGVIAGLVPAISIIELRPCNFIIEVAPRGILFGDKSRFINSRPMLDIFLALYCLIGRLIDFEMHETVNPVLFCVAGNQFIFVLVDSTNEIVRYADI
jgi:hypothetical protein